jgi:hypothetical protein
MILVEETSAVIERGLEAYAHQMPSLITDSGKECCCQARNWFMSFDRAIMRTHGSGIMPMWIRHRYVWGANSWPMKWCDVTKADEFDCGVSAALTIESLRNRGYLNARSVSMLLMQSSQECAHWRTMWQNAKLSPGWIIDPIVYHEAVAMISADEASIQIWDPDHNHWFDPHAEAGYGRPVAIRVHGVPPATIEWGDHRLIGDRWSVLP